MACIIIRFSKTWNLLCASCKNEPNFTLLMHQSIGLGRSHTQAPPLGGGGGGGGGGRGDLGNEVSKATS